MIKRTLVFVGPFLAPSALINAAPAESFESNVITIADLPLTQRCYAYVPEVVLAPDIDPNTTEVEVLSDSTSSEANTFVYKGNVKVTQGLKELKSDTLTYNSDTQKAQALGNIHFTDGQVSITGAQIDADLSNDTATSYDSRYQFHGKGGRGKSDELEVLDKEHYNLYQASYTSCPPGDKTWEVRAKQFEIDNEEELATAKHATFWIQDVPVFYFPYFSYPIGSNRKSGFLIPSVSSSSDNGITYEQPIYWNIAPNQDATFTIKTMAQRGVHGLAEYRYLLPNNNGQFNAEFLDNDKKTDEDRYLMHWNHNTNVGGHFRFNTNYTKVSDDNYFNDLGSTVGSRTDNQLLQTASTAWLEKNWNAEIEVRDFQVLGGNAPHVVMPKVAFNGYYPTNWNHIEANIFAEITKFDHKDDNVYVGTRYHLQPKLLLPLYSQAAFLNTELSYLLTHYQQTIPDMMKESWYRDLDEDVTRSLPSFSMHGGFNFERETEFLGESYTQTLIPQVKYLYVPYRDQSNIGLYDSSPLQLDYYGLFRDQRYSGIDRIADANQVTVGVSTSYLDDDFTDRFRFAIGQMFYLEQSRTSLPSDTIINDDNTSALVAQTDFNFDDNWFFHGGIEVDTSSREFSRGNTTLERRWAWNKLVQLNYRYIKAPEDNKNNYVKGVVNQIGTKAAWPFNDQWSAIASYYYDADNKRSFETLAGIKYEDCCWALSLVYDRHMKTSYGQIGDINNNYDLSSSIKFQIELKGLAGFGSSASSSLSQGLFSYGRPFANK
ncbi:LPS assembly protein LptD [Motilimonas sp. 1_MG-2023]|uniref:LPS assembly protein LptD n=1 Tax=Motilimonas sp. 1_MG-2023 TaxID=3062672 RepID=UPI0026E4552F|nr:LPS assembly protein LptD [Motilimonas sp. 1_MG-2023]MDO6527748.1 LPS assembly protein LptD [Motilimonas sp. 1_MG-2023]